MYTGYEGWHSMKRPANENQRLQGHPMYDTLYRDFDVTIPMDGCEGIRQDEWKYIRMFDGVVPYDETDLDFRGRLPEFEQLFNLKEDPEEKNNLIKT